MEKILRSPVDNLIGSLSHDLQGLKKCQVVSRIPSINRMGRISDGNCFVEMIYTA